MKVAIFYGHYSTNIGDLAINQGLSAFLNKVFGANVKATVFFLNSTGDELGGKDSFTHCANIQFSTIYTTAFNAIRYLREPKQFAVECDLASFDVVLINGGEHLFSYEANENWFNLFWRMLPLISSSHLNIKAIPVPSTYGPFQAANSIDFIKKYSNPVQMFPCRDSDSKSHVASIDSSYSCPELLDMAFFLPEISVQAEKNNGNKKVIGIVVRPEKIGLRQGVTNLLNEDEIRSSISYISTYKVISSLVNEKNCKVKLFIQASADEKLTRLLYQDITKKFNISEVTISKPSNIDEYRSELSNCDCIYTSRFHALILSLVSNTPVVASYFEQHGHKMPGIMSMLRCDDLIVNLSNCEMQEIEKSILNKIESAIIKFNQTKSIIENKKDETIDYYNNFYNTQEEIAEIPLDVKCCEYQDWWPDIVKACEEKHLQTAMKEKNSRHLVVLEARKVAYEKLKKREHILMKKIEKLQDRP
ncbi:polysaccharide pyruvyl transferase family protein [Vreelandella janggokensis]|uniref:Polysaccharide pyruvyl transferase family protein n=1 Tax=Vreelandella janggokensis TaxID=370767 RepID=A0ABT4IQ02_9GAMM|nr:polysaccharide pyruvyl transferase family protein [Halomonas janggokensis]MCZ0925755.1 polysaccharide pyruvyl transferase family protein [Halomonas janggokensis]